ncbi:MAG: DUF2314 domain-containing protein [Cyanobacteria bacterium P01_C01_bin.89]
MCDQNFPLKLGFEGIDWSLEDCHKAHQDHPETFEVPNVQEVEMCREGDLLRLHFLTWGYGDQDVSDEEAASMPRAERMWVEVCQILSGRCFRGHLTNQPQCIKSLNPGDIIEFEARHVAQIYLRKGDPKHPEFS